MNQRQLLALKYAIEFGTLTKASKLLKVSQSAVSQLITTLEQELGFSALERNRGKVSPTPQGESFLIAAEQVLDSIDRAKLAALEIKNLSTGNFRIASSPSISNSLLPAVIPKFNKEYPDMMISSQAFHSHEAHELIKSQIFDLGIYEINRLADKDSSIADGGEVFSVPSLCIFPKNDKLADKEVIYPKDLEGRKVASLYYNHPTTAALRNAFHDQGVEWHSAVETNQYSAVCQIVKHSGIVGWTDPFSLLALNDISLCARVFKPEIMIHYLIKLSNRSLKLPHAAHMLELIQHELKPYLAQ
jgi:DNA-binding transcriptional LysR family regulator